MSSPATPFHHGIVLHDKDRKSTTSAKVLHSGVQPINLQRTGTCSNCWSAANVKICYSCGCFVCEGCMSKTQECCIVCATTFPVWVSFQPHSAAPTSAQPANPSCAGLQTPLDTSLKQDQGSQRCFQHLPPDAPSFDVEVRGKPLQSAVMVSNELTEDHVDCQGVQDVEGTTLMLCNIPCSFSRDAITDHIQKAGFSGKYEFVHVPLRNFTRKTKAYNLGYAFVKFKDISTATSFASTFNGCNFPGSDKVGSVKMAHSGAFKPSPMRGRKSTRQTSEGWIGK
mmetsp:Transcript_100282/g.189140  ORF Transcript_100282/g.189140 Transcript_100282/m.189140 type:complete len:282 (+) Transcript_100282:85-930(+)